MNLDSHRVHQPYLHSFEIIHDPIHQVHQNPRVLGHVLPEIDYKKAN